MKDILKALAAIDKATQQPLTESAVAESNFDSKKTSTGTTYTRKYDPETGETTGTKRAAEPEAKRGRGRPKKDAGNDGEVMKPDWSAFGIGKVKLPAFKGARKIKGRDMVDESAVMSRAMEVIENAVMLEKEMTPAQKTKREEIVKAMKADGGLEGFKKRYGDRAEAVMYATATKKAMSEGFLDKAKEVGKKVLDTLGHPDDEEMIKRLQKDVGVPQTGKKPEQVAESVQLDECPADSGVTIMGAPDALVTMMKLAGMPAPAPVAPAAPVIELPAPDAAPEEEVDEEYANEPDEEIQGIEAAIPSGDDLHKEKGAYKATAGGDNPMAIDEELWAAYEELKAELQ